MRSDEFFDDNQGLLLSIESAVIKFYREHPTLLDHNVDKVYEGIQRTYEKAVQGKNPPTLRWKDLEEDLFNDLMLVIKVMSGENSLSTEEGEEIMLPPTPPEVIVAALKLLRKSIGTWTGKTQGRRGYLDYVDGFIP